MSVEPQVRTNKEMCDGPNAPRVRISNHPEDASAPVASHIGVEAATAATGVQCPGFIIMQFRMQ